MRLIPPQTQPLLVRLLALTAWVYVALAAGPLVSAARAAAITNAYGSGADDTSKQKSDPDSDDLSALSVKSDEGINGTWSAFAAAFGPDGEDENILLRARAESILAPDAARHTAPGAAAYAEWTDKLKFENPEVFDARRYTGFFVYFRPVMSGTLSGPGSTYRFEVKANGVLHVVGDPTTVNTTKPDSVVEILNFFVPAISLELGYADLDMKLYVAAGTILNPTAEADFTHTAVLPTLILADADGNYVPGTEKLRIVGESGLEYSVVAAPEPTAAALLALGGVPLLRFRRRRRRIG
jgi:hypothetical protein